METLKRSGQDALPLDKRRFQQMRHEFVPGFELTGLKYLRLRAQRERAALHWVEESRASSTWLRLTAITPYYPNPLEFRRSLAHAIACGAAELAPSLSCLDRLNARLTRRHERRDLLCGNAYGGPYWRCRALEELRLVSDQPDSILATSQDVMVAAT